MKKIDAARRRGEKTMVQRLAGEMLDAAEGKGSADQQLQLVIAHSVSRR